MRYILLSVIAGLCCLGCARLEKKALPLLSQSDYALEVNNAVASVRISDGINADEAKALAKKDLLDQGLWMPKGGEASVFDNPYWWEVVFAPGTEFLILDNAPLAPVSPYTPIYVNKANGAIEHSPQRAGNDPFDVLADFKRDL